MSVARAARAIELPPSAAFALWVDTDRWRAFVEGLAVIERLDADWPAPGAAVRWRSGPGGRGTVSETVLRSEPGALFATHVEEQRLHGTQTVSFAAGTVGIELDYALTQTGPLHALTDLLFIRRAEREALERTLARFAAEASGSGEAALAS